MLKDLGNLADYYSAWCEKAIASGIDQLVSVAQSSTDHAEGLLSYSTTGMTNGRMQGIKRKIKTMRRQFYGLRDNDFFRLKLYALHESKHKVVG